MTKSKRGLGRGLDALLDPYVVDPDQGVTFPESGKVLHVPIHSIDTNTEQPRKHFDETALNELADSIRTHGIVQPLIVVRKGDRYLIIAGERRFRAAKIAGLKEVPVLPAEYDEAEIHEVSLIENIQRENLNPVEEASAIRFLMQQYDMTQEEVAYRIGKSRPSIANSLRLLSLPDSVLELLKTGALSAGHGKVLAGLDDPDIVEKLAGEAVRLGYPVRALETRVKNLKKPSAKKEKGISLSRDLASAEAAFREALKTKVRIHGTEERGTISIEYFSRDDLDRIYTILTKE